MTSNQNLCQSPTIDSRFLKNDLENIFEFEEENGQKKSARCKLKNDDVQCNFQAMGTSVSKKFNLWRHVKRNHPKIYDELVKQKDENDKAASDKKRGNENDATPSKKKIKTVQENMSTYFTSSKVTITIDASTFQEGLVEMICLSMVPFTSFTLKNKGFQKIVGEMAKKLGVSMGHDAVRHLVITTADSSRMKVAFQAADLTPGMFMKEWCKLEKCLEENGEYVALGILSSMRKRKEKLLHNTHFLAGVYVDARYRILLNKSDKIKAREGLADIQLRLKRKKHFEEDCKAVEDVGRIKVNVFEAIAHYPDRIRQSSRIAASMPTSQASVERLFSALKLILSDNRQSMKEDLLSAILFIRMND
ncbi:hypothetical protein HELRODRAFT_166478 [Helobdella robusta]|uniref:HAT C-terminal dimerisation domain-containing protein n=1 Tax=Helobdella robusta TaxID=6412 RepID=T1EY62_HELRO|nr:hypothetical protein HELRODRAFT_166478 [Helobdella robusta]ESO11484.1 hypothetical protein HELRODRAFT_166478 [Helobdella robusta]